MERDDASFGTVTCVKCGASFEDEEWAELALTERIGPEEVSRILLNWPPKHCIEVRSCKGCGRAIVARCPVDAVAAMGASTPAGDRANYGQNSARKGDCTEGGKQTRRSVHSARVALAPRAR